MIFTLLYESVIFSNTDFLLLWDFSDTMVWRGRDTPLRSQWLLELQRLWRRISPYTTEHLWRNRLPGNLKIVSSLGGFKLAFKNWLRGYSQWDVLSDNRCYLFLFDWLCIVVQWIRCWSTEEELFMSFIWVEPNIYIVIKSVGWLDSPVFS